MKKGIRVVRGPDWNYDNQDGGEGGVGTVVEVHGDPGFTLSEKYVIVRWDVGEKHQYRIGEGDAYDLLIFNNATIGVSHNLPCDGCSDNLLEGMRWRCTCCGEYNLCSTCYMSDRHDLTHEFLRFDSRHSEGVPVPSRSSSQDQRVKSRGIFTGAKVCRGANWMWDNEFGDEGMQGEVVDDKKEIVVQWPTQSVAFNRIGEEGLELLKCVIPANGVSYYKSHLPILGKTSVEPMDGLEQLIEFSSMLLNPLLGLLAQTTTSTCHTTIRKGFRVVRGPDWKWAEQDGGEGHTGTILQHTPLKKHVIVVWNSGECCEYRVGDRERFDLRLLDSAPAGVRHINAKCSECQQAPLFGLRWQCSVCQGYDLCSLCYHSDKHDLSHSFLRKDKEISRPVPVPARLNSEKIAVVGMAPGAKVQRGKFWRSGNIDGGADKVGQVVAIKKWNPETRRSRVDVLWPGPLTTPVAHRYGHRGKVELKCITPAPDGSYYRDHLPVLGKKETVVPKYKSGDKVNTLLEVEEIQKLQEDHGGWTDQMDTHRKKVGTVIKIDDYGVVTVRYDDGVKLMYNQDVLNQIWLNPESLSVTTVQNSPINSKEMKDELIVTPSDTQSSHVDTNEDHKSIHPECKICLMRDACVAFVPCGHLVSCPECAGGLDKCPICRSDIKQWLRTFIQ